MLSEVAGTGIAFLSLLPKLRPGTVQVTETLLSRPGDPTRLVFGYFINPNRPNTDILVKGMFPLWLVPKKMMCRRDDTQGPDPSAVTDACNKFRSQGQKHNISRWATGVHISKSPPAEPLTVSDS